MGWKLFHQIYAKLPFGKDTSWETAEASSFLVPKIATLNFPKTLE